MATVTLEKVTKIYPNGNSAVSELDLEVAEGELMVLVGPSGSGKTTALRMVAGLEEISSGTLRLDGEVVNELTPRARNVAMVFQNYALYPHMTVAENIGLSLRLRKVGKPEIRAKVAQAAQILGLSEYLDRRPGQLSGGQRQRVAMGRAIVREPAVFLMDEPLSNLDAKLRVQMRAEIARIQRRVGVATLYVTHDQTEAMTLGDRVAVLHMGRLQQCGPPQALYEHPDNLFVAAFIGSPAMNLYEAVLLAGGREVRLGRQVLALPDPVLAARPGLRAFRDRKVILGIRPESLSEASGGTPGDRSVLSADAELVEALGNEILVHFTIEAQRPRSRDAALAMQVEDEISPLAGGSGTARAPGVARMPPRAGVRAGSPVSLRVDTSSLHFFDPDTERAIW